MLDEDRGYCRTRIQQERSAANSATCPQVRAIHLKLLELYEARLQRTASTTASRPYSASTTGRKSTVAPSIAVSSSLKHAV